MKRTILFMSLPIALNLAVSCGNIVRIAPVEFKNIGKYIKKEGGKL
jgi:hypothetical protein